MFLKIWFKARYVNKTNCLRIRDWSCARPNFAQKWPFTMYCGGFKPMRNSFQSWGHPRMAGNSSWQRGWNYTKNVYAIHALRWQSRYPASLTQPKRISFYVESAVPKKSRQSPAQNVTPLCSAVNDIMEFRPFCLSEGPNEKRSRPDILQCDVTDCLYVGKGHAVEVWKRIIRSN